MSIAPNGSSARSNVRTVISMKFQSAGRRVNSQVNRLWKMAIEMLRTSISKIKKTCFCEKTFMGSNNVTKPTECFVLFLLVAGLSSMSYGSGMRSFFLKGHIGRAHGRVKCYCPDGYCEKVLPNVRCVPICDLCDDYCHKPLLCQCALPATGLRRCRLSQNFCRQPISPCFKNHDSIQRFTLLHDRFYISAPSLLISLISYQSIDSFTFATQIYWPMVCN